jgi:FkbH-like protein
VSNMKWRDIIKRNQELGDAMSEPIKRIALLGNVTVLHLKETLELELREEGLSAEIVVGNYDSIVQDSERYSSCDAVLIFWEAGNLVDGFHDRYNLFSEIELNALTARVEGEIQLTLQHLALTPLVLINRFSSKVFDSNVLRRSRLNELCNRLNSTLEDIKTSNQIIVDIDAVIAQTGLKNAVDFRHFLSAKSLYSREFCSNYARLVKPAFLAASGYVRKVLVLDCDNTLWGGVLGEDGESQLEMSESSLKGKAFQEVQYIAKGLKKNGILLALCSKNNQSDVDHVIDEHPDMTLRNEDFVAKKVNWKDKATNLIELAKELNLGLDSFVFVDDSEFEIGLIKKELPEVRAILVPKNISEYPELMRSLQREFFSLSRSEEDRNKTFMYQVEQERIEDAHKFSSIDDYLSSLELKLSVLWDHEVPVPRAAQMTQKTNQFNLCTRRYTESDIERMLMDDTMCIAVFGLSDRYGDYGITGMCITSIDIPDEKVASIDTFLMSCRVIGRNVEYIFFDQLIKRLKDKEIDRLEAEFISTPKNKQVERFYDGLGLKCIGSQKNSRQYELRLSEYESRQIDYILVN